MDVLMLYALGLLFGLSGSTQPEVATNVLRKQFAELKQDFDVMSATCDVLLIGGFGKGTK